ncbi:hypothetical protein Poli38472_003184 [Pythium oligandrum]|uniref:HECT-type E3 ubiquitin transferase n=1 Tax=Pythium oligandrum TaxID=41045 RepID=A0A8K1C6C2_PYTOL|nr:hypothetical protein Poli38472_003184 [Pythium oligandrum]|eukprot:TMW57259.1 hypothetical protein Poli38472_003184 [Pythium oligandrum]
MKTEIVILHLSWCTLLIVILFILTKKLATNRRFKACQRALLSSDNLVDHRIDAAKREAEHGFLPCPLCGFENFTRSHHCAICGSMCFDLGPDQAYHSPSRRDLTPVQRRARMRKEWQRKVDVQGRIYWYRNAIDGVLASSPAFVVQFQDSVPRIEAPTSQRSHDALRSCDVSGTRLVIVAASDADAARFADRLVTFSSIEQRDDFLLHTSKDFPSKYSRFVITTSVLFISLEVQRLKLSVHRDYILEQSIEHLTCIPEQHIRSVMRIDFLEESGIDAGGLHREWFMALIEMFTQPDVGLFVCTNRQDQTYYLNHRRSVLHGTCGNTSELLLYYYGAGRLVGRALLDGAVLGFHFSVPLLKLVLGMPISLDDLEYYDAELHRNLRWLLENNGAGALGLDFSVCETSGFDGEVEIIDLVPNGRNVAVTDANKQLYVERKLRYTLVERVADQLQVFLKGIYEVMPPRLLLAFDYEELDYLLCGTSEIDVDDWERNTRISLSLEDNPRVLRWFWELVREMNSEYRRRLLQFSTGCARVPIVGFKGLTSFDGRLCPFTLKGVAYVTDQYIRSHACFNLIDLPLFRTKEEMQHALYATLDTDVYGFTTV